MKARVRAHEPQPARRLRDHRHRLSDRSQLTSELLGFCGPTGNTYGSIATVDYLLESTSAATVLLTGLGRFVQDLLLWCTAEFGYLRLGDGFVQGSSIMPQKRNPVALEHARAIGSKALGQAQAIVITVHNTPFGDIVDTEDDLQPLVFAMFRDATRAVKLVAAAMSTAEFDAARLEARAGDGWTTLTELADTLVARSRPAVQDGARDRRALRRRTPAGSGPLARRRCSPTPRPSCSARRSTYTDAQLAQILSPRHFVEVRRTLGGPAPEETARAADVLAALLEADEPWWTARDRRARQAERDARRAERRAVNGEPRTPNVERAGEATRR